ncbi:MlaA family lipoprotein, partial [Listeria monocytogenes]|uniref:MlaA family lipoprotein n=1 Tax=Listeria monocytogenes TaxID=1639 RepID=UPI001A9281A8
PVYNATTTRELTGALVDNVYTYPFWHWVGGAWSLVKYGVQEVATRAKAMNTNAEALLEQSADPYITFREAYYQNLEY